MGIFLVCYPIPCLLPHHPLVYWSTTLCSIALLSPGEMPGPTEAPESLCHLPYAELLAVFTQLSLSWHPP